MVRADRSAGESIDDWRTREWLQSPFVVTQGGQWFMFYGGHGTGQRADGSAAWNGVGGVNAETDCQICLMTSDDGRTWTRRRNAQGQSRLFLGPGEARDPCVVSVDGRWHVYYAGYQDANQLRPGVFLRTSDDLVHWSDWALVHSNLQGRFGSGGWRCECPHVVYRDGYYYLFRTESYVRRRTHVSRSENPNDFGIEIASDKHVGLIEVGAPEVIIDPDTGQEYITSNHDPDRGTMICRLSWVRAGT